MLQYMIEDTDTVRLWRMSRDMDFLRLDVTTGAVLDDMRQIQAREYFLTADAPCYSVTSEDMEIL